MEIELARPSGVEEISRGFPTFLPGTCVLDRAT